MLSAPSLPHTRLFPAQQFDGCDHCAVEHARNRPDEPAVLRLAVAPRAEGIEQEDRGHTQPVDGTDLADRSGCFLVFARIVTLLQQLFHSVLIGPAVDKRQTAQRNQKQ